MKNIKKWLICFLFVLFSTTLLVGCGSKSLSDSIIGRWEMSEDQRVESQFLGTYELEFFSDGTYISNRVNYCADYSIDGDRLKLGSVGLGPLTFTAEIKDDTLTLTDEDSDYTYEYQKVE